MRISEIKINLIIIALGFMLSISIFVLFGYKNVGGIIYLIWLISPYVIYGLLSTKMKGKKIVIVGVIMLLADLFMHGIVYVVKGEIWKLLFGPIVLYGIFAFGIVITFILSKVHIKK